SSRVARLDPTQRTELARLLPQLLVDDPQLAHPAALTAQDQRQRMFDALTHALLAPNAAVLLVADDLHWCDPATMRFLHYLLRRATDARLLVAATGRREEFDAEHPLNDLIASLRAAERFSELEL